MTDYYAALGVSRTAGAAEIKQAFRKLASQHHPDKGGDTKKFQEIQAAYAVLGDEQKRAEYDNPRAQMPPPGFGGSGPNFNFDDIFSMFGARFGPQGFNPHQQQQQSSIRVNLWISIDDVAHGGPRTIGIATGRGQSTVEIVVPPGIDDGDAVRYNGVGPGGTDIIAVFRVQPSTQWQRNGADVSTEIVVPVWDLILGRTQTVVTVNGRTVEVSIPAGTQPNAVLRLRGYGLPKKNAVGQSGDMMLRIQTRLPESIDQDLLDHIRRVRDQ